MDWKCLLVDLDQEGLAETWAETTSSYEMAMPLSYIEGENAKVEITAGSAVMIVVFAKEPSNLLLQILDTFRSTVGAIEGFQVIICDDPSPQYLAQVHEFNIRQFFTYESWALELSRVIGQGLEMLNDPNALEATFVKISRSITAGDTKDINAAEASLGDSPSYDYLAAYHKGRAYEATGRHSEAIAAFLASTKLNNSFRPSSTGLGENLLIAGRVDEAIKVFEKLDKGNPWDVNRKINLASAHIEKGNIVKAEEYINAAADAYPEHPRVKEARVQVMLAQGKVKAAFEIMDSLSDVGPFLAAKLNDLGIKLSQSGKGKVALALYAKAHKIVRPELRYKITLNTALACHRLNDFQLCLKYLNRCEKEYGSTFDKIEKIRAAAKIGLTKQIQPVKAAS